MTLLRAALALLLLAHAPAWGQARPPLGGNVAIPSTPGTLIPFAAATLAVRYQVQGTGYACVSWVTASISISGSGGASKCAGAGAFLVGASSVDARLQNPQPGTPLVGVAAAGADLVIVWEAIQ